VINTLEGQYHTCELDFENDKVYQELKKQREIVTGKHLFLSEFFKTKIKI
jgi:hypothetical protein